MGKLDAAAIGQRLRDLRGDRTLQAVAADLGIGISTLCMYETGERIPRDEIKAALARLYGKTVQEIFFD